MDHNSEFACHKKKSCLRAFIDFGDWFRAIFRMDDIRVYFVLF